MLEKLSMVCTHRVTRYPLLTAKPVIYAANVDEDDLASGNAYVDAVRAYAAERGGETVVVSARTEDQLARLPAPDRAEILEALGVSSADIGLDALVRAVYVNSLPSNSSCLQLKHIILVHTCIYSKV